MFFIEHCTDTLINSVLQYVLCAVYVLIFLTQSVSLLQIDQEFLSIWNHSIQETLHYKVFLDFIQDKIKLMEVITNVMKNILCQVFWLPIFKLSSKNCLIGQAMLWEEGPSLGWKIILTDISLSGAASIKFRMTIYILFIRKVKEKLHLFLLTIWPINHNDAVDKYPGNFKRV